MIETVVWWHWVVFGVILAVTEIVMPLFIIIWFGLSAVIIGLLTFFLEMGLTTQVAMWTLVSLVLTIVWFVYFKNRSLTNVGQSNSHFELCGTLTQPVSKGVRGSVRFDAPLLGSTQWLAISDETLDIGTKVRIVEINGQLIKITKEVK